MAFASLLMGMWEVLKELLAEPAWTDEEKADFQTW